MKVSVFWFRRDLRLQDNIGLSAALSGPEPVIPLFIFDSNILDELPRNDARVQFIHERLLQMHEQLASYDSGMEIQLGDPLNIWKKLLETYEITSVHTNRDYEPYALERDTQIAKLLEKNGVSFKTYKDQVVFETSEILKDDGSPYTVYTPYKNKWLQRFHAEGLPNEVLPNFEGFVSRGTAFPSLADIGFEPNEIRVPAIDLSVVPTYEATRNFPAVKGTSFLSTHLRFGTVSPRGMVRYALNTNATFLNELIWREFFMQILYHFPEAVNHNFRRKYDGIQWRNNEEEFQRWCEGTTGYPMVDAGMRELNQTGLMHNRVRMVVASFLCKHLLIDWRWGEAYFAEKLLDFDLSANNGNWQWAAGTGCDAAPYFRVFNPTEQLKKFDPELKYTRKWVPELDELTYPQPMVDHKIARDQALKTYKAGIEASAVS